MSLFHRMAHMQTLPLVKVGQWVTRGKTQLGTVGSTGNSSGPHCHYDIQNARPASFTSYVEGWTKPQVVSRYLDPHPYVKNGFPLQNTLPLSGYGYLQYVIPGGYYHPGMDLNSANDLGKPIYAPCDGRVVYVQGISPTRNWLGRLFPAFWGNGWGCMVMIEQDPHFDITKTL